MKSSVKEKSPILPGTRFTRLTVIARVDDVVDSRGQSHPVYRCQCDCGNFKDVTVKLLKAKKSGTKSCGCLHKEAPWLEGFWVTHGKRHTREYNSWTLMKGRCNNSAKPDYADYGGRGITYDTRWEEFEAFYTDMGVCPALFSLDRKDVHKNYTPDNCRWASPSEQAINRRKMSTNTSGRTGVFFDNNKQLWMAVITHQGTRYGPKGFPTFEDAVGQRIEWEVQFRGEVRSVEYETRSDLENS